jgi:integrase
MPSSPQTGWRLKSEILPLEWRQVDWQGRVVRLDPGTTKNREGRTYPFTAALEKLLKDQLAEHDRLKKANRIVALVSTATASGSRTYGKPGIRHVRRPAVRGAFRMISGAQRFETLSAPGCRGQPQWRWSATRPKPSIAATRSSTRVYYVRPRRRSITPRAQFRAQRRRTRRTPRRLNPPDALISFGKLVPGAGIEPTRPFRDPGF